MSEPTSVRPDLLDTYARTSSAVERHLADRSGSVRASYHAFLAGTEAQYASSNDSLLGPALTDVRVRLEQTRAFLELVADAARRADCTDTAGLASLHDVELLGALAPVDRERFELLLDPTPVSEIDPPTAGVIPRHSGFVDDPVCTATGHFLEDEVDLVMPARLAQLAWPRRYSSRQLHGRGHGPGWWTWADVTCRVEGDRLVVVCPDGRHIGFPAPERGEVVGTDGADVALMRTGDGGVEVVWGSRSPSGRERWSFGPDGRPTTVRSDRCGTFRLAHDDDRLVSMTHEGGRAIEIDWRDGRIEAVRASDGRHVRYTYGAGAGAGAAAGASAGAADRGPAAVAHLEHVERATGARRYDTDAGGRIVAVTDADGVVCVRNRYDDSGRVVRQVAATGRVTLFQYHRDRRTTVLDGAGRVVAEYGHDRLGRVESLTSPHGPWVTRRFDGDGHLVEQASSDGDGFVATPAPAAAGPATLRVDHTDGRAEVFVTDAVGRIVEHRSSSGRTLTFAHDGDTDRLVRCADDVGALTRIEWSPSGALLAVTDGDGVTVQVEPDADGLPRTITDGLGRVTEVVARHPSGVPVEVRLPDGGCVTAEVDDAGRLQAIRDAAGTTLRIVYTPAGRLATVDDPRWGRLDVVHDEGGLVVSVTDAHGAVQEVVHDEWSRPILVSGPDGGVWSFEYSALGVLTELQSPSGARWSATLGADHRLRSLVDPLGRTTVVDTDPAGRVRAVAGPASTIDVDHDDAGRVATVTATPVGTRSMEYDPASRVVLAHDADGVATVRTLSRTGRVLAVDDVAGRYRFGYDGAGQLAEVRRDADGAVWHVELDWRGAERRLLSPEGRSIRVERDLVGRPTTVDVRGAVEHHRYDRRGLLTEVTPATGRTRRFSHDDLGRLAVAVAGDGGRSSFGYDAAGRIVAEIDPFGHSVVTDHDVDGNVAARTDQLGRTTRFERAVDGTLRAVVDPDGRRLDLVVDDAGRTRAVVADGVDVVRYRYDGVGRLVAVDEPVIGRERVLATTPAGRLVEVRERRPGTEGAGDDGWEALTTIWDDGRVVGRRGATPGLDASWALTPGLLSGEVGGHRVAVAADRDGCTTGVAFGAARLVLTRDSAGRVAETFTSDGAGRRRVLLTRDDAGRVVEVVVDGRAARYHYDEADRLVGWVRSTGDAGPGPVGVRLRHDVAGRPRLEVRTEADGSVTERRFGYDEAHQLVTLDGPAGRTTFDYDGAGRRVVEHRPDGTERRFVWDALGRLTAVVDGDVRTDIDIDCFGVLRRAGTHRFDWDHSGPEPVLAGVDGRSVVSVGRRPIGFEDAGGAVVLLPAAFAGPAADLVDPFTGSSPTGAPGRPPTGPLDCGIPGGIAVAGVVWLGDRFLDPATRQFLSPDPLRGLPGAPTSSFPYHYADGDPINRMDPTGRDGAPISIDDFDAMRAAATGVQWGNVAMVAGAVVMTGLVVTGAGAPMLIAAGALAGAAQGAGTAHDMGLSGGRVLAAGVLGGVAGAVGGAMLPGGSMLTTGGRVTVGAVAGATNGGGMVAIAGGDTGGVIRGAVGGGVFGGLAAVPGSVELPSGANLASYALVGVAQGTAAGSVGGVAQELVESYLPGGDGRFDLSTVGAGAGSGFVGGVHGGLHDGVGAGVVFRPVDVTAPVSTVVPVPPAASGGPEAQVPPPPPRTPAPPVVVPPPPAPTRAVSGAAIIGLPPPPGFVWSVSGLWVPA